MARAFEQVIRLKLQQFSPEAAKQKHIEIARAGLATFLGRQLAPPEVALFTDGHAASSEQEVKPFGVITYRFSRMNEITTFALQEARRISPVRSGRYRDSWFPLVDGREVAVADIPAHAEVVITNDQPYSRKINSGAPGFEKYVPPGIAEKVRQLVLAKYKNLITANVVFTYLEGGYVLKRHLRKVVNGRRYGGPRADAMAGMEITYPSISITPKFLGG